MNVSEPGVARARGGPIDARHAARTRPYASRPSGTASKLFGGKVPSICATGYLRAYDLNAIPTSSNKCDTHLIGEIEHLTLSKHILNRDLVITQ